MRDFFRADTMDTDILLDSLIDNVSDNVVVADTCGMMTRQSRSFKSAIMNAGMIIPPLDFEDIIEETSKFDYKKLFEYVQRENKAVIDFRIKTILTSGEDLSLLSVIPIDSKFGSKSQLLYILRSANDNATAAPDYGHIEKLTNVGKIAAGMAHELNTPLGSIVLSAEHIKEAVKEQKLAQEASRIKNRAEYCSKVVKDLLGYVRHDEQIPKRYNLLNIVTKVVDLVSSDARSKDIKLGVIETGGNVILECNENQIEQLLFNLIDNASHAINSNGRIDISFRIDQLLSRIYVVIKDSGSGIEPKNIPNIFDPFFTTKPGIQGTGLGLALCKKIALEHGGDISVKSEVGQGATFEVWIPLNNE